MFSEALRSIGGSKPHDPRIEAGDGLVRASVSRVGGDHASGGDAVVGI
jgi:hypothetical protein